MQMLVRQREHVEEEMNALQAEIDKLVSIHLYVDPGCVPHEILQQFDAMSRK